MPPKTALLLPHGGSQATLDAALAGLPRPPWLLPMVVQCGAPAALRVPAGVGLVRVDGPWGLGRALSPGTAAALARGADRLLFAAVAPGLPTAALPLATALDSAAVVVGRMTDASRPPRWHRWGSAALRRWAAWQVGTPLGSLRPLVWGVRSEAFVTQPIEALPTDDTFATALLLGLRRDGLPSLDVEVRGCYGDGATADGLGSTLRAGWALVQTIRDQQARS